MTDGGTLRMYMTEQPGTWLVESQSRKGVEYIVKGIGTPFLVCSCPQSTLNHGDCKHVVAILEQQIQELDYVATHPEVLEDANVRALVPIISGTIIRADLQQRSAMLRAAAGAYSAGYAELLPLAAAMVDANLVPKNMTTPMAALVMQKGLELGIPPTTAFEFLYVVDNRIKVQGQMVLALIQRSNLGKVEILETSEERCRVLGTREGYKPLQVEWTLQMAKDAGLTHEKSFGWKKYPADMLRWKAIARVGRLMFADLLGGMDVADAQSGEVIDSTAVVMEAATSNVEMPSAVSTFDVRNWNELRREHGLKAEEIASFLGVEKVTQSALIDWLGKHRDKSMRELCEAVVAVRGVSPPNPPSQAEKGQESPPVRSGEDSAQPSFPIGDARAEPPDVIAARQARQSDEGEYREVHDPEELPFE